MADALKEKWQTELLKRYTNGQSVDGWDDLIEESVNLLESIYLNFVSSGMSDSTFAKQLYGTNGRQYEQRLGEMLFFHRLQCEGFAFMPTNGVGPDFCAVKEGVTIWFEVITPEGDQAGTIETSNNDANLRLHPNANETHEYRKNLLLRGTSAIDTKQKQFSSYIKNKLVNQFDPCVIVLNDTLLCPFDLPMYGVTHGAENPIDGRLPLAVHATMAKGYQYLEKTDVPDLWKRSEARDCVLKDNGEKISVTGFIDGALPHISAVIQVTLREDYALAQVLKQRLSTKVHEPRLQRGLVVLNSTATNPLPPKLLDMDVRH